MKLRYAALYSGVSALVALLYTTFIMRLGLRMMGVPFPRQSWLLEQNGLWQLGIWLWLFAIFGWMLLHVTLTWSYLPAHRVATMLQSGLLIIAAVLGITASAIWMGALPWAATQDNAPQWLTFIDQLVLPLAGSALFMGGIVTTWQTVDLARLNYLAWAWVMPGLVAGLIAIPSPFILPRATHLFLVILLWSGWCFFLAARKMPRAFAEWQ